MLLVRGNFVTDIAQLLVAGVGGEEIDVGQVRRITLAQIGNQFTQGDEAGCVGFVSDVIGIEGRMPFHALDQRIQLFLARGVVQGGRREQFILQLAAQTVSRRHVELGFSAPNQIPTAVGHLLRDPVRQVRSRPIGDDGSAHPPRLCGVAVLQTAERQEYRSQYASNHSVVNTPAFNRFGTERKAPKCDEKRWRYRGSRRGV
ncbi:MAG: hypothetical protein BWX84_02665 [Verrucomicrobia bacterium ADurb.Bin118]|nr:MAG: hypothetical protein BWX84_02665 [Verrucomicrobia bacterium ADurb.Bin118]